MCTRIMIVNKIRGRYENNWGFNNNCTRQFCFAEAAHCEGVGAVEEEEIERSK